MAIKLHGSTVLSSSSPWLSNKPARSYFLYKNDADRDCLPSNWGCSRRRSLMRVTSLIKYNGTNFRLVGLRRTYLAVPKSKLILPFASADDGMTVNGSPQTSTSSDVAQVRVKLDKSLQGEEHNNRLVQTLHDAARVFELAIREQSSLSGISWFPTAWIGVDRNAWVKDLSYQASVYSLLQAGIEISAQDDTRDQNVNDFVQRSFIRQSALLENLIRDKLLSKKAEANEWFWSKQIPAVVTSFIDYFKGEPHFSATTSVCERGVSLSTANAGDVSLLMLALACIAAITKLGPAKLSCSQFFSTIPDTTGRLMDMLVEFTPIWQAYYSMNDIGLLREFLVHFGPRAASCHVNSDWGAEEVIFWVDLVQKQLQRAIDRERIWSRLTTSESIEVLERDLSIFGFFIALGRSTQSFLSANGFDTLEDPLGGFVGYLIGGSVLYYPQLSSISSYQLYVEVVCEELDWFPFYPGSSGYRKQSHGHKGKKEGPPNAEAIPQALDTCSRWIQYFIKYSKWLENPSNVKAERFLSTGRFELIKCKEELGIPKSGTVERSCKTSIADIGFRSSSAAEIEPNSIDKALESVDEALIRLENLLQELHMSSSNSGKEHLKAACSDLEKIRKLKKEAEFLEASFRAKAASLQQQGEDVHAQSSVQQYQQRQNKRGSRSRGLLSFLRRSPVQEPDPALSTGVDSKESIDLPSSDRGNKASEPNDIHRFELLRTELMELEKRVQRSTNQPDVEQLDIKGADGSHDAGRAQLAQVLKKGNIIEKSLDKLKETTTDVWQGTQLLAIDVAAAMGLLRRILIGDELTEKEKNALQRTLTDLASVVPIGVLMLLPVTAVGHAAILAAIQRYVPALIPSTYGPERLDLLRQLEKVKEMETREVKTDENMREVD